MQDASCAAGVFLCRGSEALPSGSYPPSKKEYFLTATTPQSLARGVTAQLVQKPRRVSPPQRRKKVSIIFSGDMRGEENTSQAASVEFVCPRRTNYARSRLQPLCQKGILFDSGNPAGSCSRGDGSACSKTSQSFANGAAKESPIIFFGDMCGEENTARPANPPSKKEYFLTATTPQALARGVSAQLVQKPRRVSPPQRRKKVKSFSQATCAAEKILLRLQVWNLCAVGAQIMRAADCSPFVKAVYCIRGGPCPLGLPCGSGT